MPATITFDADLHAVISVSGPEVTRDSMSDAIRMITSELAANDCDRLIVDMSRSDIAVPIENTTIIIDRLLNAMHSSLTVALVFNDRYRAHFDHVTNYLGAGMVEVERFGSMDAARDWLAGDTPNARRA